MTPDGEGGAGGAHLERDGHAAFPYVLHGGLLSAGAADPGTDHP